MYCYTGISCVSHTCRFYSSNDLIKNYKDVHDQIIKVDTRSFSNFDEFEVWKTDFEKTSNSTFVLHSAPNNLGATISIVIALVLIILEVKGSDLLNFKEVRK